MTRMEHDLEALFEAQTRSLGVDVPPTIGDATGSDRSSPVGDVDVSGPAVVAVGDFDFIDLGGGVFEPLVPNRRPWWPVVAVAAVVSLTVSLLVVSFRDVGESPPAALPPAEGASPDHVGDATAFWNAVVAGDRAAALGYVDPTLVDAGAGNLFGRAETLPRQFDWYEAVGWQWTLQGCMPADVVPDGVQCKVTATNSWSEALGVDPVTGTFVLQFGDDGFLTIVIDSFGTHWSSRVFEPFAAWVRENHPDDAEVMWGDTDVNTEMLDLFEVNTERFVNAQLADRSTTTIPTQEEP